MSGVVHQAADLLLRIEEEMRVSGLWAEKPPTAEALRSHLPFCVDTLVFEQWLQWVFVPRIKTMLESGQGIPHKCVISPMAEESFQNREIAAQNLINLLAAFDYLCDE